MLFPPEYLLSGVSREPTICGVQAIQEPAIMHSRTIPWARGMLLESWAARGQVAGVMELSDIAYLRYDNYNQHLSPKRIQKL